MGGETGNLVAKTFRRDDGDLFDDLLIHIEIKGQLRVIFLNDLARGPLDKLSADTTLWKKQRVRIDGDRITVQIHIYNMGSNRDE